jgi:chromosome partitioning protein
LALAVFSTALKNSSMTTPATPTAPVVIAVANAKGGVGKTSIVANLAGITALAGWRVLVIDLDPQGNLATDLGITDLSDLGASLAVTLSRGEPPITLSSVRPRLDVWAGGPALATSVRSALIPEVNHPLQAAIGSIGANYDFVYIDCPPALGPLVDAGLTAADLLLVPIRADHASLSGLHMITARFTEISSVNPGLELLGITLFDVSRSATAIVRDVADAIAADFADLEPRLLPAIRRSERSAFDMRRSGLLAYEYEQRQSGTSITPLAERIDAERSGTTKDSRG